MTDPLQTVPQVLAGIYGAIGFLIGMSVTVYYWDQLMIAGDRLGYSPAKTVCLVMVACVIFWPDLIRDLREL